MKLKEMFFGIFTWLLTLAPWIMLCVVLLNALCLRSFLGHWPVVYRDSPPVEIIGMTDAAIIASLALLAASIPFYGLSSIIFRHLITKTIVMRQLTVFLIGLTTLFLLIKYDPTGYIEWFLD